MRFLGLGGAAVVLRSAQTWSVMTRQTGTVACKREVLDKVAAEMGIREPQDWKSVQFSALQDVELRKATQALLEEHKGSPFLLLQHAYPGVDFLNKQKQPNGHWDDKAARRAAMDDIGRWHGVEKPADWARVTTQMAVAAGGGTLLNMYGTSLRAALEDLYPEHEGSEMRPAGRRPRQYWLEKRHRREYLDSIASQVGVKEPSDWMDVSCGKVRLLGGGGLLNVFNGSLQEALKDAYPEAEEAWTARKVHGQGYWDSIENQRAFVKSLEQKLGLQTPSDWKKVTQKDVIHLGGRSLLGKHGGSLFAVLEAVYGEEVSAAEARSWMPKGYWAAKANRREFMDKLSEQLGIKSLEDWRTVTTDQVKQLGGSGVLQHYGGMAEALTDLYAHGSETAALAALTCRRVLPATFWADDGNVREFLEMAKRRFNIRSVHDWARLSHQQVRDMNGGGLLQRMSLGEALRLTYPREDWSALASGRSSRSSQRLLFLTVAEILAPERRTSGEQAP